MALGLIDKSVLYDIANAIRGQNGLSTTYKPGEMAAVIRALTWKKYVPRAVYDGSGLCMDYWFYNLKASAVAFEGWRYVHPASMSLLFNGSLNLVTLDLTGLDASSCAYWNYAFSSMSALTTIYMDSDWALPASFSNKSNTFYSDSKLVGGNGTTYSSSKTSADYAVIDSDSTPGFLTAVS